MKCKHTVTSSSALSTPTGPIQSVWQGEPAPYLSGTFISSASNYIMFLDRVRIVISGTNATGKDYNSCGLDVSWSVVRLDLGIASGYPLTTLPLPQLNLRHLLLLLAYIKSFSGCPQTTK